MAGKEKRVNPSHSKGVPSQKKGIQAVGRFFRSPPDKVRIMGRTVVGLQAAKAKDLLAVTPNKSAQLLGKLVKSAIYNAEVNFECDADTLWVKSVMVDRGPMIKRYHPCAHGRAKPILKRTCHITVKLESRA